MSESMNFVVLVKQVPDTETKIRITSDKNNIETGDVKWVINPYDEFAIEQALKTKEAAKAGEVTVISLGPARAIESLRVALAMGADQAIHIPIDDALDSYQVGFALAAAAKSKSPALIFAGKQAIDDDSASVFSIVAEILGIPFLAGATQCEVNFDSKKVSVAKDAEGGESHEYEMPLPCLVAVDKAINTPRYASLPGIMKAKKKEIPTLDKKAVEQILGQPFPQATFEVSQFELPPERPPGKKISGDPPSQVKELVRLLHEEAKVL